MNDVARVSRLLVKIESQFPVNELVYKGVCAWPLLRGHLASELFLGQRPQNSGSYLPLPAEETEKALAWVESSVSELVATQADALFMTVGFEYALLDDCWYNKFFDPLKEIIHERGLTCLDLETGFPGGPFEPKCHPAITIAALIDSATHLREAPGSIARFGDLATFLVHHGIMNDPGHERFVCRLETMLAEAVIFRMILEKAQPKAAFLVCYYHDRAMAFLKACHDLGIPSIEVQHSIIEPQCMHYSNWTSVPTGGYELMPDAFWTWGETAAEVLRAWDGDSPENPGIFTGGNLWLGKNLHASPAPELVESVSANQRTILFTLAGAPFEPVADLVPATLLEALDIAPLDWKWIVRLHYKMDDRIRGLIEDIFAPWRDRVDVQPASQWKLYDLFKVSDYHVCILSTTQLEAEAFGLPNIVIGSMGAEHHRSEIDSGIYLFAGDGRELYSLVANRVQPARRIPPLMLTDATVARNTLATILDTGSAMKIGPGGAGAAQRDKQEPGTEGGMPEIFTIETTLACDLRCPECAIGGGMIRRDKRMMSFEQFRIIADKIRPYARYVYLHMWGEPLLNPDIFRMISYTAQFARTNISTNGMSLTRDKAEALISSGISEVIVSIDGVSQEVYEQYRVGGDVRKTFESLEILAETNLRHGGRVAISPQFVVFRHNQQEMEEFSRRCTALGLQASFKAPYLRNGSRFSYSDFPEFHRPQFDDVALLRTAMRECQNPREVFTVLADGSVVICCHDYEGVTCFGNIFRQEVMEIWNSPEYAGLRRAVLEGRAPDFCVNNCMTWILNKGGGESGRRTVGPEAVQTAPVKINLCCGSVRLSGFINIDVIPGSDLQIDLEQELLPFPDGSVDCVVCISAINYFSYQRAGQIVADVHRVLKPGGIARFATQDLQLLARYYLEETDSFYFEKLADGRDRFPGRTRADKFNEFFYGFHSGDKHCKYVYDFESLAAHFRDAGFALVEKMPFGKSRIAGAELFDNRPEQMFFLEAVKEGATSEESYREVAFRLWSTGDHERAWQYLLEALYIEPGDRLAVTACAAVLQEHNRLDDITKLYEAYLVARPDDRDIISALDTNLATPRTSAVELGSISQRIAELDELNSRLNSVLPDRQHLDAAMVWLRRAQQANPGGGVAAVYHMDRKQWGVDYPETTGYIITTFLSYANLSGDSRYRIWACDMGNWEVAIQSPGGGIGEPVGVYGQRPRVFNTGQVILGWAALYRETSKTTYLDAACRAADWIVGNQDQDGKWTNSTYTGPKAYKCRVSWALMELYALTGNEKYREGAERSIRWILSKAELNGWFDNNSLSDSDKPWTHLIGYVLVGMLEACRLNNVDFDRNRTLVLLHNAARGIMSHYMAAKKRAAGRFVTLAATFDRNWQSDDSWSCVTGTAQIEFFMRRLSRFVEDPLLVQTADMLLDDIKRLQFIDGISESDMQGGLPSTFPLNAPYGPYSIQNWAVKFYADSLLQRLLPEDRQIILG